MATSNTGVCKDVIPHTGPKISSLQLEFRQHQINWLESDLIKQQNLTVTAQCENRRLDGHCRIAVLMIQELQGINHKIAHWIERLPPPGQRPMGVNMEMPPAQSLAGNLCPGPSTTEFRLLLENLLSDDPEAIVNLIQKKVESLSSGVWKALKMCQEYKDEARDLQKHVKARVDFRK